MKKISPSMISVFAGILLILLAYWLDRQTYNLRPSASQRDFGVDPYLEWMAFAYFAVLLMAGLLLGWVWFSHHHVRKQPVLSLIYLVLGAMMSVYSLVMISLSMSLNSPSFVVNYPVAPLSLASFTGAVIACFGLQRLVLGPSAL